MFSRPVRRSSTPLRVIAMLIVAFGVAGTSLFSPPVRRSANAEETFPAAIVEGSCDDLGETAAELRSVAMAEGGALTSFTTVDLALADLLADDYAIVVGETEEPIACGEIDGDDADDLFLTVPAIPDSIVGGVVWLHANEQQTRVTLLLGHGLSGNASDTSDAIEPPSDEEPEPEETPEPDETSDEADTLTYTSPSYGYTITYDRTVWFQIEQTTTETEVGPSDSLRMEAIHETVAADFISMSGGPKKTAKALVNMLINSLLTNDTLENVRVRLDENGEEMHGNTDTESYVVIDFTFTDTNGVTYDNTYYIKAWELGTPGNLLMMSFQSSQELYDDWADERQALEDGVVLAGE